MNGENVTVEFRGQELEERALHAAAQIFVAHVKGRVLPKIRKSDEHDRASAHWAIAGSHSKGKFNYTPDIPGWIFQKTLDYIEGRLTKEEVLKELEGAYEIYCEVFKERSIDPEKDVRQSHRH